MMKIKVKISFVLMVMLSGVNLYAQTPQLDKNTNKKLIENICTDLKENYIYPDMALKMIKLISEHSKAGAYDTIVTPATFASKVTHDLQSVCHDEHLALMYDPRFTPPGAKLDVEMQKQQAERAVKFRRNMNFGFNKAEILPGNIGYLDIRGFFPADPASKEMALAAFRFVSNSNALIIDLRNNGGGNPDIINYVCGFLFTDKTHLNDMYFRKEQRTIASWSIPDSTLKSMTSIPIYILTSKKTFSAGEEFAYDLQAQKRAVIIGENTGGGAHPFQAVGIGEGLIIGIPFARSINPITKTDWEKTGVKPDIQTSADKALETALSTIKSDSIDLR